MPCFFAASVSGIARATTSPKGFILVRIITLFISSVSVC